MKAPGVFILRHHLLGDFHVFVGHDPLGPGQKAQDPVLRMGPFRGLEQPGNDVVASGGRPAGQDNAEVPGPVPLGLILGGHHFQEPVLADEWQLLPGHFQDFQLTSVQGPGGASPLQRRT
jgi:hypothetical protein